MVAKFVTSEGASRAAPVPSGRGRRRLCLSAAATAVVVLALQLSQACSFRAAAEALSDPAKLYKLLDHAPYVEDATVFGNGRRVIDAPKLKVDHGYMCASAPRSAGEEFVGTRANNSVTLPAGFAGTVLLNGWYLEYLNGDHHVLGMGAAIYNIAQNGNELSWDVGGVLSDRNADDEYMWCYNYTIIAWAKNTVRPGELPKAHIDMAAIHADATGRLVFVDKSIGLSNIRTKVAAFKAPAAPRARLLAGFGMSFDDKDHHLMQFGLDLGEASIKRRKIKWRSEVILKDKSAGDRFSNHHYGLGQLATILTGESVQVMKPELILLTEGLPGAPGYIENDLQLSPSEVPNVCVESGETSHTYKFKIDGVPFTWAMPMLTGWDVHVVCNDEHVKRAGAWIEDFDWVRNPGDSTGTLYYTVKTILEDSNPDSGIVDGMQVEVLGINLIEPPGAEGAN